jgi:predicted nucleic acid-binding Zn ribbon protein
MSEGKLAFAWRTAVGPSLDRVSEPLLREDGTVEVVVGDAAWRKEMRRSQALILAKLQDLLGASVVRKIKIVGGGRPGRVPRQGETEVR